MSLLFSKLSALQPGSPAHLTNKSGQTIEGIVTENDGTEALTIQVTSVITIRYDQVGMIDQNAAQGTVPILPVTIPGTIPAPGGVTLPPAEILTIPCDRNAVSKAFKAMESKERRALTPAYDKFQSYLKSHEASKGEEAIQYIWEVIEDNDWYYHPAVNCFLGMAQLAFGEFLEAAKSFFAAGDLRYAYLAAYQGAGKEDMELYEYAAAFSVISLMEKPDSDSAEALEVLRKASVATHDRSGVAYALQHAGDTFAAKLQLVSADIKDNGKKNDIQPLIEEWLDKLPAPEETEENPAPAPVEQTDKPPAEPNTNQEYDGKLVVYKFYEEMGKVETEDGKRLDFDLKDITDASLKAQVKKITTRNIDPIAVKFNIASRSGKQFAVNLRRGSEQNLAPATPPDSIAYANLLYTQKNYEDAIAVYRKFLTSDEWETAYTQIISCYLALCKENDEIGYVEEMRAFVDKYIAKTTKNAKTLEVLQQYYMKIRNYKNAIDVLNDLMELCDPNEHSKILHYLVGKARCYRFLQNYDLAIGELLDWLDIVKRNKMKDRLFQRDNLVCIELAELYFEIGDYDNAGKYLGLSGATERKQVLKRKLAAKLSELAAAKEPEPLEEPCDEDEEEPEEDTAQEPEESLQTAYEGYLDTGSFETLGMDEAAVLDTALHFAPDQLHCLLTYLKCATMFADAPQTLQAVHTAVSFAFNSPFTEKEYISTEVMTAFDEARKSIPAYSPAMLAASAMYALFRTPTAPDYSMEDFVVAVENYGCAQYPSLLPLLHDLLAFRQKTGYGMDAFSGYRTSDTAIQAIIEEANACCTAVDMRNDVYESQGQVRRMREFLFSGTESELRNCLNIAAANDTKQYQYVKDTITELFIRSGKSAQIDNVDPKKLDKYIDRFWDYARDVIQDEGRHISRPHDKIKGSKRNNVVLTIRRILACICDWITVGEHVSDTENAYAQAQYKALSPRVMQELAELLMSCEKQNEANGFDWGNESIRRAALELQSKMDGSYSSKSRKYFFIDFLRGEDILLDDSYLPEVQSTFSELPDYHILHRIERHASHPHPELHERLTEILSDLESKHNFRTARLIRAYGEDKGIPEITQHKDLPQYHECFRQAKRRFENKYQDFRDELELCESYGTLSNINGEKDALTALAYAWYRITRVTGDYGFYLRLLEVIRSDISAKAAAKGEQLRRQLQELVDKNYDFGVFTQEMIEAQIDDQNYASAEFSMNCIIRGDVRSISDYAAEPFGYFKEFISEHATNYRAVRGAGKSITDTIFEFSNRKDLEKALLYLTNNARKETKGGANLLKSWMPLGGPANEEQLEKLLTRLGFKPVSIQRDTSVEAEAYQVFCRKQIGKVNYVHQIPAFGSKSEQEGFRVLCLYGKYDCDMLMEKFREVNTTAKSTIVLLDFALNVEERRRLARKSKEEKSFAKPFIVIDRVILYYLAKHYAEHTVIKRLMAVTLPFAYYQPFIESSQKTMPPELFTGRAEALTSIESADGANLVYGGRQLGKSALLKMAQHNIDHNANGDRAVLVEELKDRNAADAVVIVCNRLITEGILDESCRCEKWSTLAEHLQKRLKDDNPETRINYLLLMLDEADEMIRTGINTEDSPITALKSLPSDRFKLVMAGLHNLSRYNREVKHGNSNLIHLNYIIIKQFRREEATRLLTSILAYLGFRFTQKIIDSILASTYNYPGLIQFYCQKLLEAMKAEDYAGYAESSTPPYEVTESHYTKVLADKDFTDMVNTKLEATLFTEEKGRSNYHIIALILAYLYDTEQSEKGYDIEALLRVAQGYHITRVTSLRPEQLDEILSEMLDLNVLIEMDGFYRFSSEGFRNLLGDKEKVEKSMADYFEEETAV